MIRFGLIGAGVAAETCARELRHVEGAVLRAVYARSAEKARRFAAAFDCEQADSDLNAFLAADIDAIVITTPNGLHLDYAIAAARAGKHVVVEKPLEINETRAAAIIEACAAADRRLFVIYQRRYARATLQARQDIAAGKLGQIVLVNIVDNQYRAPLYYSKDVWRGTFEHEGGGCVITQSTHMLDLAQFLLGPVRTVYARSKTRFHAIETEDTAVAALEFDNDVLGTFSSSTAAFPGQRHLLTVSGTKGSIIINAEHDQIVFRQVDSEDGTSTIPVDFTFADPTDPRDYPTLGQRAQYQAIVNALSGKEPPPDADQALQAVRLVDAIYRSAKEGRPISLAKGRV